MKNFTHYCFDMDGTLIDSHRTIYNSTILTLDKLNIKYNIDEDEFARKIGQHFLDIFDSFNVKVNDFEEFIGIYKKIYLDQLDSSKLYNNVESVLSKLKDRNVKVSLLTTKAQDQAEKIIKHFSLTNYFDLIMGRRDGIDHKPSAEPLIRICNDIKVDVNETLMIGDTELDIQCGKNAGSFTCGVIYGYRTRELLEIEKPDFIVESIDEILNLNSN
jgi:HAD superfamily hydrolase (TIGR01549 family)